MKNISLSLFIILFSIIGGCNKLDDIPISLSRIVAHAGYWQRAEGGSPNTIDSYIAAIDAGIMMAETDIRQTGDGVFVLVHDEIHNGMVVAESTTTSLGLPKLEELLKIVKQHPSFKLLIEIKAANVYDLVALCKRNEVLSQVEFISFSINYCQQLINMNWGLHVSYLGGDIPPLTLKSQGYSGMAYNYSVYNSHPEWIRECKKLKLTTYVWTVDRKEDIRYYINQGIDFIITNCPAFAIDIGL